MGEFGYQPRIRLLDGHLTLDPQIISMIQEIEAHMVARRILADMMRPNWNLILPTFQSILSTPQPNIFAMPVPPAGIPAPYPNAAGPVVPRAVELSDIAGAIYQLPAVQGLLTRAHDEGLRQVRLLRTEWERAPVSERIVMVTMTAAFAGALITPVIANQPTRDLAFGLIKGHDIPIPGVGGLSFQILDAGGSITAPLGIPGLSGRARLQLPNSAAPSYEATITFDVMAFLRSRSSSRP